MERALIGDDDSCLKEKGDTGDSKSVEEKKKKKEKKQKKKKTSDKKPKDMDTATKDEL